MIGRIKNLSGTNRSGFILAENGQTVYFAGSAVWEHDFPLLTVGQAVSFELQAGHWPKAVNVHLFEDRHRTTRTQEKAPEAMQLRYVGFDQAGFVRTFRFQGVVTGELTRDYAVTGDVRLFQKYRVGIQEGPALCARLLLEELELSHDPASRAAAVLSDKDFATLLASRAVAPRKPFRRRPRPVRPQNHSADHQA